MTTGRAASNGMFVAWAGAMRTETIGNETSSNNKEEKAEHKEGPVARSIEKQTAKLPSDLFLWAAGASILLSLTFEIVGMVRDSGEEKSSGGRKSAAPLATFFGMWVPSFLLLGVYNKIVKVAGSDRTNK